jgi:3-oxoacyl-[acyl-carrier-protein] synthase-1
MAEGAFYFALPFEDEVIQKCNLRRHFLAQASEYLALPETKEFLGVQMGSTGVYALIERAMSKMQSGEINFCIIAAVDSYLLDDRLHLYDQQWRIKTGRNPAGFIPGEAGAVLLLETEEFARNRKVTALLRIDGVHSGQENNSILGEKTSSGTGLTDAIRSLADVSNKGQAWQWVLSDLNGERYKAFEWGLVQTRLNKLIANDHHLSHIADVVGDIGAAMAAVQVGYVSKAFERGFAPANSALLFSGSDEGKRYAMALSKMH